MKLNNIYKNKEVQCFGYDYPAYYQTLLSSNSFMIPIRPGKEVNIKELDFNNLQYGIYNVKIKGDIIRNVFAFNKLNCYTHYV